MSKSNSSTRSNSVETPGESEGELNSPQKQENVPAIMEVRRIWRVSRQVHHLATNMF